MRQRYFWVKDDKTTESQFTVVLLQNDFERIGWMRTMKKGLNKEFLIRYVLGKQFGKLPNNEIGRIVKEAKNVKVTPDGQISFNLKCIMPRDKWKYWVGSNCPK